MEYIAKINIMPRKELLDPQGKTIRQNFPSVGVEGVDDVRVGKRIEMYLTADSKDSAEQKVDLACRELLTNVITETYDYELIEQS